MALMSLRNAALEGLPDLQRELARLREAPTLGWNLGPSSRSVFPPLNVFEDAGGALVVRAEAPGIDPATLQIDIEPHRLVIAGERRRESDAAQSGYHRRERRFGRFSRSLQLPADLDVSKTSASYRDGMLTVRVEKAEAARPRRIPVA